MPVRLFYMDDSGTVKTGWIVYSWVEFAITDWNQVQADWLNLRRDLYAQYRIPPSVELHTARFVGGRGNPSTDPAWNRHKRHRSEVLLRVLTALADSPHLRVGTVYRATTATGPAYAKERADVYERLIRQLDARLGADSEYGMVFMDGNGTDPSYAAAHRALKLDVRNVVEDPLFQHSHNSQSVQMADLIAWSAYQGLARNPGQSFAWDWYARYLQPRDVNGGPVGI